MGDVAIACSLAGRSHSSSGSPTQCAHPSWRLSTWTNDTVAPFGTGAWCGAGDARLRGLLAGVDAGCAEAERDPATIRRTVGIRLHDPGDGHGDRTGLAVDADGLAGLFDDLAALGIDDAIVWSPSKSAAALDRIADARRRHLGHVG